MRSFMPAYNLIGFDPWVCLKDGFLWGGVGLPGSYNGGGNTHTIRASMDGIFTYMNG